VNDKSLRVGGRWSRWPMSHWNFYSIKINFSKTLFNASRFDSGT